MNKLPYEYVSREVDRLFDKQISEKDTAGIDAHCTFIVAFINACGWTEEEYIRAMFGFVPLDRTN